MRVILSFILLIVAFCAYGQKEINGNWYTCSFDGFKVVQCRFDSTIITVTNLDWELKPQPGVQTTRIINIIKQKEKLYYLLEDTSDTNRIILSIISSIDPGSSFVLATASDDHTNFKTLADVLAFIEPDTLRRPGLIFYSQKEFDRLRTLPPASAITKEHYKIYLQGLIETRSNFEEFASKNKEEFAFLFIMVYLPNQARKFLAQLGYNPFINDKDLEQVNEKFKNDPTLKDLMDRALKFN